MAIPQQLAREPSATAVQEFCNMAPGIPWTNQMLDDIFETLDENGSLLVEDKLTPPVKGLTMISAFLVVCSPVRGKPKKQQIEVSVNSDCDREVFVNQPDVKFFDFNQKGFEDAICFVQQKVQNMKRRGLCETCLTNKRPMKGLRVGDTDLDARCLLHKEVS